MIELTFANIRDHGFQTGIGKLSSCDKFDPKLAYTIGRIKSKIETEAKVAHELFVKMVKANGDLDEATGQFKIKEENQEKWKKEVQEFSEIKFTIEKHKLNVADLTGVQLTPNEVMALEPILFGLEVLEGGKNGENN